MRNKIKLIRKHEVRGNHCNFLYGMACEAITEKRPLKNELKMREEAPLMPGNLGESAFVGSSKCKGPNAGVFSTVFK